MKKLLLIILSMVFPLLVISQPCPDSLYITNQSQIDSFQIIYPNCTEIEGDVNISGDDITSLNGLSLLTSIEGSLEIRHNDALTNLMGLEGLTSIVADLNIQNTALANLTGLDNVTSIGGYLWITYNYALTSLAGLDNIESSTIEDLYIYDNSLLSTCDILSICNYLGSPNGNVTIENNFTGCNSPEEVMDSCEAHAIIFDKHLTIEGFSVSPNPFTTSTTLSYTLDKPCAITISILNSHGQIVEMIERKQLKGEQQVQWDANGLPPGMYYYRIQVGNRVGGGKMVLMW